MTPTTRTRRLDNEWQAICRLAALNPNILIPLKRKSGSIQEIFSLRLRETNGLQILPGADDTVSTHCVDLRFPRFYPAVPLEAYLQQPVFHPNIDPVTGFLCLWDRTSPGDTATDAIRRVQAMIVWKMFNLEAIHTMQPDAAIWFLRQTARGLPLRHTPIREPADERAGFRQNSARSTPRRGRLSTLQTV